MVLLSCLGSGNYLTAQEESNKQKAHGSGLNLYFQGDVVGSYVAFGQEHLAQYGLQGALQSAVPNWGRAVILNDLGFYGRAQEVLAVSDSAHCGILPSCHEARNIEMIRALIGLQHYDEAYRISLFQQQSAPDPLWRLRYKFLQLEATMFQDSIEISHEVLDQVMQEALSYSDDYLNLDADRLMLTYQVVQGFDEREISRLLDQFYMQSEGMICQFDFYNLLGVLHMHGYDHGVMSSDLMTKITSMRLELYKLLDIPKVKDEILQAELIIQLEQTQILGDIKNDQMSKIEELALRRARQNRFLAALVVLLAIFITVLGVIFMRNKQLTSKLADAREKLSEHNQLLEQQVTERTKQLERKFEEFKEYSFLNSHKLRLPISQLESMMEAYKESGDIKYLDNLPRLMDQTMLVIGEINDSLNPSGEHKAREIPGLAINHVVFIDDDLLQNMANEVILKKVRPDIHVATFQNPVDALDQLETKNVQADLIFLDIQMPQMDGFDVLDQLQTRGILTPVVMLSSSLRNDDKKKAFQYQLVLDYIEKPLRKDWLKKLFHV